MEATESQPIGSVTVTLEGVIKGLPDQLKSFIAKIPSADDTLEFPQDRILPQLTKGSVKVTFGEIIKAAPPGTFEGMAGKEGDEVPLPLGEILPQIGPGAMKRQSATQAPSVEPQAFFTPTVQAVTTPPPTRAPVPLPSSVPSEVPTNLFSPTPSAAPAPTPAPAAAPTTAANLFSPVTPEATTTPSQAPPPASPPAPADGDAAISLAPIIEALPNELKALIASPPDVSAAIELPVAKLIPQLAKGKIIISFSELVAAAPSGTFSGTGGRDSDDVQLPLAEVLSKVGPGAFKRSAPVKKLEGLEQDFFGSSKPAPAPEPVATPAPPPTAPVGSALFNPAPPAAAAATPSQFFKPALQPPAEATPPEPEAVETDSKDDDADVKEIAIPIVKLVERWPNGLKAEVAKFPEDSVVVFPAEELGNCLKTGKVAFTWARIRGWLHPKTQYGANAWESSTLDIPLKSLVAPFMAAMRGKPMTPLPKGRSAPASPASPGAAAAGISFSAKPAPKQPAPTYTPPTFTPSTGTPSSAATGDSQVALGALLGLPSKEHWTPVEIVQRVAGLPAVSGALLSLAEGQVAASELPSSLPADLLAFRIPRLYNAAEEQLKQMALEPMAHLDFTSGRTPWVIFKLGNIFFTVCGRPGEPLPVSRLQSIAVEVGRQPR